MRPVRTEAGEDGRAETPVTLASGMRAAARWPGAPTDRSAAGALQLLLVLPAPVGLPTRLEPLVVDVAPAHHAPAAGAIVVAAERGVDLLELPLGVDVE